MLVYAHVVRTRKRHATVTVQTRYQSGESVLQVRYRKTRNTWQCRGGSHRIGDTRAVTLSSDAAQERLLQSLSACRETLKLALSDSEVDDCLSRIDPLSALFLQ